MINPTQSHSPDAHKGLHTHDAQFFGERTELYFACAAAAFLGAGFFLSLSTDLDPLISVSFYVAAYFSGGFFAVLEAIENLRAKRFEIDTLMIVAAAGAAVLGEWGEGALLLVLFSLGHALEHYAMGRAKKAIEALAQLAPKTAQVLRDGVRLEVKVEELVIGDRVIIRPNERIPVDGILVQGSSAVNQAPVTGESIPVDKVAVLNIEEAVKTPDRVTSNSRIFAGTINGSGALEVAVTKLSSDTTLARVARMVADAQAEASPTQQFTKKFEKYFVPAILAGVILLLFSFLIVSEPFSASFYRAMAVLVAASPCALAISTPSAVLSGIARAGRAGVLIKGGAALENLGKVRALAFDKTGTLTEGRPALTDVISTNGFNEKSLLRLAAAVEVESDHPLARAVVEGAKRKFPDENIPQAKDVESLTGRGIRAQVEGKKILIGKPAIFEDGSVTTKFTEDFRKCIDDLREKGRTLIVVQSDDAIAGVLGIMDAPRKSAAVALAQMKDLGIEKLIMLSGDNQKVASAIAAQIGLTEAVGDLMPEDKVLTIKRLRKEYKIVAMVGDGVNDSPALASASVGIAMGAMGSDVALETADVALMTDDLSHLAFAVGLSRKASLIIRQNLWISLSVVAILIPATIFGLGIGPAVAMHEGSTIVVVFNALRLLAYKK